MAALTELVNVHGHRIFVNTNQILRLETKNENPDNTTIVMLGSEGDTFFEVMGLVDDIAAKLNREMSGF